MQPFTLLIKPSGSDCNVDCTYCFYKSRPSEIGTGRQRMSDKVLEKMTADYMKLNFPIAGFAWQGGEPTLMGLDFYKKVVELQSKYCNQGQLISNSFQTNAILFDDDWCKFLSDNNFLVGISIDGPKKFHDYYRLDYSGRGTFDRVVKALELCKTYKVQFNALILLNKANVEHPDEVIDFFRDKGVKFLQFIPCVEVNPSTNEIADFSVTAKQFGDFLCRVFDRWCEIGPKNLSIRDFDSIVSYCVTGKHTICTFDKQCSAYIVIEHNGDAFCCDFFVEPRWRLGNIFETPIDKLAASSKKKAFARAKQKLCNKCLICRHLALCRGGCMKDRAPFDKQSFGRESYFCESYKQFFDYSMPRFMQLAAQISAEQRNNPS